MGSEHVSAYELGGGTALRGLNWPRKRHAIDDAFLAELGAGMAEGAAAWNRSTPEGSVDRDSTAPKFIGAELLELACRAALMSLLKEKD
jgi:hypothetical protein